MDLCEPEQSLWICVMLTNASSGLQGYDNKKNKNKKNKWECQVRVQEKKFLQYFQHLSGDARVIRQRFPKWGAQVKLNLSNFSDFKKQFKHSEFLFKPSDDKPVLYECIDWLSLWWQWLMTQSDHRVPPLLKWTVFSESFKTIVVCVTSPVFINTTSESVNIKMEPSMVSTAATLIPFLSIWLFRKLSAANGAPFSHDFTHAVLHRRRTPLIYMSKLYWLYMQLSDINKHGHQWQAFIIVCKSSCIKTWSYRWKQLKPFLK